MSKLYRITFPDRIKLKWTGCRDGRRGLPRKGEDGFYTSPFLDQELHLYETYCADWWSDLVEDHKEDFVRLNYLKKAIVSTRKKLKEAREKLAIFPPEAEPVRKSGEEDLSDLEVKDRRDAEYQEILAPYCQNVKNLEDQLAQYKNELTQLACALSRAHHQLLMNAEYRLNFTLRRLDIYWDNCLRHNPDLPPVPYVQIKNHARTLYESLYGEAIHRLTLPAPSGEENEHHDVP